MIKYTAVIINYNCLSMIKACIDSVIEQTFKPIEIRIVDSASKDGSAELIKKEFAGLKLLFSKENIGFSKAVNNGIYGAEGEYLLVLNSDVVLDRFFMENILKKAMLESADAGIFCGKLLKYHNNGIVDSEGQFLSRVLKPKERGYLNKDTSAFSYGRVFSACGAAVVYKRSMIQEVSENGQLLDEDFFMYFDDLDLGWRANTLGWKVFYVPEARAIHARGGSERGERKLLAGKYAFARKPVETRRRILANRYYVLIKNCPLSLLLLQFPFIVIYELAVLCYIVFSDFRSLAAYYYVFKDFNKMAEKRRKIFSLKKFSSKELSKWII